jgi:Bacterial capsule synthesis protein PGA_cap
MSLTAPRAGAKLDRWAARLAVVALALSACDHATGAPGVTVWLAGDVHLGQADGPTVARRLAALAPFTDGVGVVNLEGPVAAVTARPGELANHPVGVAALRGAGVRVVGIANNHADDGGRDPRTWTRALARGLGLLPVGGAAGAARLEVGGVRLVISAHDLTPGFDRAALATALADARAQGDVLVATFHVTAPSTYAAPAEAIAAVAVAQVAGARVIAVHGSHAVARVERTGATVIAWGLGNLLFDCACTDEEDGLVLQVTLDRDGLVDASVVPIAAGLRGQPATPARDPALMYELLAALRSTPLAADGARARLLPP